MPRVELGVFLRNVSLLNREASRKSFLDEPNIVEAVLLF